MLRAILNKSWRQHPTRHQLYGHLPPITKTIQVRRTRHAGHCWRSKDELISDVLLWTPTYGRAKAGRPARTYIQQLCEDTGCNPEDLPEAMNDREKWRERVRDIRAGGTTWWWWYSHRLTHRKRVTSELHDSYFRSMTITQAIPKIAEVTHLDRKISEEIAEVWRRVHISAWEFEGNIRPTNWTDEDRRVKLKTERRDVVRKASTQQSGLQRKTQRWRP